MPWYRNLPRAAWWALAMAGLGWMFESYNSFMLALTLPTLSPEFGLSRPQIGALISITAAGQIIGGITFGYVSDRLGRVRTAFLCILISSIFSGLIAFAPSAQWLAGLRFCGALGMGGTWTAGAALVAETWARDCAAVAAPTCRWACRSAHCWLSLPRPSSAPSTAATWSIWAGARCI